MRIAHVRGENEKKPSRKSIQDQKIEELKQLFITEHNRKFERERLKNKKK